MLTACGDPASEIACVNAQPAGTREELRLPVEACQVYYVVLEAADVALSQNLVVSFDARPAEDCINGVDDDLDQRIDCADTECTPGADCVPGLGAIGAACTTHHDCASTQALGPVCLDVLSDPAAGTGCSQFCGAGFACPAGTSCHVLGGSSAGVCGIP